jgi:hypothetical protein
MLLGCDTVLRECGNAHAWVYYARRGMAHGYSKIASPVRRQLGLENWRALTVAMHSAFVKLVTRVPNQMTVSAYHCGIRYFD